MQCELCAMERVFVRFLCAVMPKSLFEYIYAVQNVTLKLLWRPRSCGMIQSTQPREKSNEIETREESSEKEFIHALKGISTSGFLPSH